MNHDAVVVVTSAGPDQKTVDRLAAHGVATVHEAMGRTGLLSATLRPIYPGARVAGRAVTVLTQPGDNLMIYAAVEQCRPGDVLVVATKSPCGDGLVGELLATSLQARGVVGAVLGSGIRDVAALTAMRFPVWAAAISAQGAVKATPGAVNVQVVLGGATVRPGDVIVADDDGVAVVPLESAQDVAAAAARRAAQEDEIREALARGIAPLDLGGLRAQLAALGVRYVNRERESA